MKCIWYDLRRAVSGRWFLAALAASAAALYMSIGSQSYYLVGQMQQLEWLDESEGFWLTVAELLTAALQGDFGVMLLPALSALPFAAQALTELKCGAIRPVVFRVGRKGWIAGKVAGCLLSGMLLQGGAALVLVAVFHGMMLIFAGMPFPMGNFAAVWPLLLRRMLCGGLWAWVGCLVALGTETASAAYLAPLCLCYAMVMIGTRFFPDAALLNPTNWITGDAVWPTACGLCAVSIALVLLMRKKVNAHV